MQVEKRQPGSTGVPFLGISKNFFWSCSPVYLAYVEKISFATVMKGFSWRNLEGIKKKKPSEKLLFENFCLTNVKSKSNCWKYFSGLLWC